ncbi:hypothetical protein ACWDUL_06855 [Nocardia niigatensis]|uniref:hypothetical protein n=1 Tax=Nocardia niigatensis TaxID=209249 RepID=UPI0003157E01|nr:hypothetical protein [Nocardia niigatensis]
MSAPEIPSGCTPVDELYCTLTRVHSPVAAALMVAAVTGRWPDRDELYRTP